jgi:NitT/TauT family transport system ATP-binding protein
MNAPVIDIKNISKSYTKKGRPVEVLKNVSFSINDGEVVAMVGPSGCGKTTILKIICGLIKPDCGCIKYQDNDISYALKKCLIGYIPQSLSLLPFRTVRKNIMLPLEILRIKNCERSDELISLCDLQKYENYYPHQLSGGMRQKVAIARALAYKPKILLMDEPMASLDEMIKEKLNEELLKIKDSTKSTIVYVTHNIEEAVFLSNRVIILSETPGTIIDVVSISLPDKRDSSLRSDLAFFQEVAKIRKILQNK